MGIFGVHQPEKYVIPKEKEGEQGEGKRFEEEKKTRHTTPLTLISIKSYV